MKITNFYKLRHLFQTSDFRFEGHRHDKYEANIILKGNIELTCGSNIFSLGAGQFAVWKPGIFHMSRVLTEEGAELIALDFDLSDNSFPIGECAVFKLEESDLLLARILEEESTPIFTKASIKLMEAFLMRLDGRDSTPEFSDSSAAFIYRSAVNFMKENLHFNIGAATIAKHCGVCLTNLKMAFCSCAGKGVKAYFIDMKLESAKDMLLHGVRVADVSDALGFSSPAYFSQCFKKRVGIGPKEYCKNVRVKF